MEVPIGCCKEMIRSLRVYLNLILFSNSERAQGILLKLLDGMLKWGSLVDRLW